MVHTTNEPPMTPVPTTASSPPSSAHRRLRRVLPAAVVSIGLGCGVNAGHSAPQTPTHQDAPSELFEVVKIVDGDTIHITRNGELVKLRLLSVDTEEKLAPGMRSSPSKPQTVFGEETRLWTVDYLEQFRQPDGALRIGLDFPHEKEAYDVFGRLLCHVLLPDGTDFNLLLVELGKSPYFNKYGNSLISHSAFVEAQARARRNLIGIWDPRTNLSGTDDTPSAIRPYHRLLPWWQARAEAIDDFRGRSSSVPTDVLAADDPAALQAALESARAIEVFGTPDRFFEEDDGSRTVLLRSGDRKRALRVSIPAAARPSFEAFDLDALAEEFRQNYVYVKGTITRGPRGFRIVTDRLDAWRRAGPEPEITGSE
jgi:micrococcal nuclease